MVLDERLARSGGGDPVFAYAPDDDLLDVTSCPASEGDEGRAGSGRLPARQPNVVKDDRDDISIGSLDDCASVPISVDVATNAGGCCSGDWGTLDRL